MDALYGQALAIIFQNAVAYLQLALLGKWRFGTHLEHMIYLIIMESALAVAWTLLTRFFYAKLYPPHQMLLIYGDISPKHLISKLDSRQDRYQIRETIRLDAGVEAIMEKIKEYDTIIIGDIPSRERNQFLKFCYWHEIRCYSIPKISDIIITASDRIDLFDSILMLSRNNGLTLGASFFKRLMDIVISLVAIIILSPIMLVITVAIKAYDVRARLEIELLAIKDEGEVLIAQGEGRSFEGCSLEDLLAKVLGGGSCGARLADGEEAGELVEGLRAA